MKTKYKVTFNGEANQKFTVNGLIFEPNKAVYLDNVSAGVRKYSKYLDIEKIIIREEKDEKIEVEKGVKIIERGSLPKKTSVVYVGSEFERLIPGVSGYFRRDVAREDLSKEEVEVVKKLGREFKVVEKSLV